MTYIPARTRVKLEMPKNLKGKVSRAWTAERNRSPSLVCCFPRIHPRIAGQACLQIIMKGIPGPASPRHCSAHRLESQAPDHVTTNLALPVPAHFLSAQIPPLSSRRGPHGHRPAGVINAHGSSRELPLRLCMAVSVLPSVASECVGNLPRHTRPRVASFPPAPITMISAQITSTT